jgi:VanZ family protein
MSHSERPDPEWRHKLFICYVAVMVLAFLMPVLTIPLAESKHFDKLLHFVAFLGFAVLLYLDQRWGAWWTFSISAAFAGVIELVQGTLPYREGSWWDFAAGIAGAGLGTLLLRSFYASVREEA